MTQLGSALNVTAVGYSSTTTFTVETDNFLTSDTFEPGLYFVSASVMGFNGDIDLWVNGDIISNSVRSLIDTVSSFVCGMTYLTSSSVFRLRMHPYSSYTTITDPNYLGMRIYKIL